MLTLRPWGLTAAALFLGWPCLCPSARAADARYFPDDTELVLILNVRQVLNSELVRREKAAREHLTSLLNQFAGEHPALRCLKEAGADFPRDLSSITFAAPRGKGLAAGLLILEGDFGAERLGAALAGVARASPEALKIDRAGRATLYEIAAPAGRRYHAALVSEHTLVVSTARVAVTDAVARSDRRAKSGLRNELTTLLSLNAGEPSVRFVATGRALSHLLAAASVPNAATTVAALKSLDGLSGAITLAAPVQFQVGIFARDDDTSKKLAAAGDSATRNLRAFVQQQARQDNKLLPLVEVANSLRVTAAGPTVLLRGEASLDSIEKLMKSLPVGPAGAGR